MPLTLHLNASLLAAVSNAAVGSEAAARDALQCGLLDDEDCVQMIARAEASREEFRRTGLHLTQEEVFDWLERVAAGEDCEMPPCHV